jgi:hypothetical protein
MMSSPFSSSDRNPVEALAEEFLDRQRRGERPTLDDYCQRFPDRAQEIRDLFSVLIRMQDLPADGIGVKARMARQLRSESRSIRRRRCSRMGTSPLATAFRHAEVASAPKDRSGGIVRRP